MSKPSPFDAITQMCSSKEYVYDEDFAAGIDIFLTNRAMSQFVDCVLYAAELNACKHLTKKMVYDYYHFSIQPKKKRFAKWANTKKDENVLMVSQYYQCNIRQAEQYLSFMKPEDLDLIRAKMDTGGRK